MKGKGRDEMRREERCFFNQMVIARVETFIDDETCTFVLSCVMKKPKKVQGTHARTPFPFFIHTTHIVVCSLVYVTKCEY